MICLDLTPVNGQRRWAVSISTTQGTPAMDAVIVSRPFDVSDLVNLLMEIESQKAAQLLEFGRDG